jgi:hypothetical protein
MPEETEETIKIFQEYDAELKKIDEVSTLINTR